MHKNNFEFWYNWLLLSSIIFALFGIIVAYFGDSLIFSIYNSYLTQTFWQSDVIPTNIREFKSFIYGPLGGTITGQYVMMLFIVYYPFRKKEAWAWYAIAFSHLFWFIIDSSISIYYKAYFNFIFVNLFTILVIGPPLIFTKKGFRTKPIANQEAA